MSDTTVLTGDNNFDPDSVYQMTWSVYFILAVSIASIAWGVVNYFMVSYPPIFIAYVIIVS